MSATPVPARLRPRALPLLFHLAVTWLVWGTSYLALRMSLEPWPPFVIAGGRFILAGALLLALSGRLERPPSLSRLWPIAFWLVVIGDGALVWGAQYLPSGQVAVLVATTPLWFVLGCWLRGERPGPWTWAALVAGLLGTALVAGAGGEGPRGPHQPAALRPAAASACLLAAFAWAWGSLRLRRLSSNAPLGAVTGLCLLAGGVVLALFGAATGEFAQLSIAPLCGRAGLAVLYLITAAGALGFFSYGWLVRHSPPALAGSWAYVNPLVALLSGHLVYGEPLHAELGLGAALVLLALLFAGREPSANSPRVRV